MPGWNKHPKHAAPKAGPNTAMGMAHAVDRGSAGQTPDGPVLRGQGVCPSTAWGGSRIAAALFLVAALAAMLVPFVGMAWAPTESTGENRELAAAPQLFAEDGSFNWDVLADAGAYFDDRFAYRNELVTANADLRAALGTSATDQVVVGSDGWLYYGGTLPDYLGQSALSDRALRNIAHNLRLAQDYVESHGSAFAFAVAPNKNSLYPAHMPGYYLQSPDPGNLERLEPLLAAEGVNYVDLAALFEEASDAGEWYLKGDSHWDNRGGLMAADALLEAVGHESVGPGPASGVARCDFVGDLESMLRPAHARPEVNWYFAGYNDDPAWSYDEGADVTDSWARTSSAEGAGSLLMFRDSFGNAVLPFAATAYAHAAFSKLVPYNLPVMGQVKADAVIVERAERHLPYLAENPPIMFSPEAELDPTALDALGGSVAAAVGGGASDAEGDATDAAALATAGSDAEGAAAGGTAPEAEGSAAPVTAPAPTATVEGSYLKVAGALGPGDYSDDASIYIGVETPDGTVAFYDAFWTSVAAEAEGAEAAQGAEEIVNDFGYLAYFDAEGIDLAETTVYLVIDDGGDWEIAGAFEGIAPQERGNHG